MRRLANGHTFVTSELLELLGLPRGQVRGIIIRAFADEPVTIDVEMAMLDEAGQGIVKRLKEYVVVEKAAPETERSDSG